MSSLLIGIGATVTFDLWALFLKHTFKIPPSNICLVGRWLRSMADGTFKHADIHSSPPKRAECTAGWIAHYAIGASFAVVFISLAGNDWLLHPTPIPAVAFGIATVFAPLFILQPLLGFGFAASKTKNPAQARIRSLMNHAAFGVGLYVCALFLNWIFQGQA